MDEDRYIRLSDGTVYGYTDLLARRRDATVVDGWAAAAWFRAQGVENEVTSRYPGAAPAILPAPVQHQIAPKPNRNLVKVEAALAKEQKRAERAEKLRRLYEDPKPVPKPETSPSQPEGESGIDPLMQTVRELLQDGTNSS